MGLYEGLTFLWLSDRQAVQWDKQMTAAMRLLLFGLTDGKLAKQSRNRR